MKNIRFVLILVFTALLAVSQTTCGEALCVNQTNVGGGRGPEDDEKIT